MEEEEKFILRPIISPSEKAFRSKIGAEAWEKLKNKTFRDGGYKCAGCTFTPYDVDPDEVLSIHLIEENEEIPEEPKVNITCEICHIIQHADVAMEKGYVELVNSLFTQGELVNICRNGDLIHHIEKGEVRYIKKTLPDFLEELNSGRAKEGKVKFVLTESYLKSIGIR
jgi:hypothetical protein